MTTQTSKAPPAAPEATRAHHAPAHPEIPSWRRKLRPYLLSIPALVIVIGILYPFVLGAYYAFLNYAAVNPNPHFVWFDNFKSVLGDQVFWQSVKVTGIFAVVATAVETVLGVGLALLLNRSSIDRQALREGADRAADDRAGDRGRDLEADVQPAVRHPQSRSRDWEVRSTGCPAPPPCGR